MPRLKSSSPQKQPNMGTGPTMNTVSPERTRGHGRLTEADLLELAYGIPSLHTSPDAQSSSDQASSMRLTSKHGRSKSHPFPSLFQSKQKRDGVNALSTSDSSDGDNHLLPSHGAYSKHARPPDKVLVTGKCMTCDSTVRWPKELLVYRCTVCLTINDLKSLCNHSLDGDVQGSYNFEGMNENTISASFSRVTPLSIVRTKALVEQCITTYLLNHLEGSSSRGINSTTPSSFNTNLPDVSKDLRELRHADHFDIAKATPGQNGRTKSIFRPLEEYIISSFTSRECVNNSFATPRPAMAPHAASEGTRRTIGLTKDEKYHQASAKMSEIDAKTLLIGDFAENGAWWTGERGSIKVPDRSRSYYKCPPMEVSNEGINIVNPKSPKIEWAELREWYDMVLLPGSGWRSCLQDLIESDASKLRKERLTPKEVDEIEYQISEAQAYTQRVVLKATESLLKRPGAPLKQPDDIRFLLIILANPLLYPGYLSPTGKSPENSRSKLREVRSANIAAGLPQRVEFTALQASQEPGSVSGQHSGIIKRVLGLLSNLPNECHHHLVAWFAGFSESHFRRTIEMVGSFVTYRLTRQHGKQQNTKDGPTAGLIPNFGTARHGASAALEATLGAPRQHHRKPDRRLWPVIYSDDWQIKAAARVMALLFSANNIGATFKSDTNITSSAPDSDKIGIVTFENANNYGQILPTSTFYNTLLDYFDLVADFEAWESGRSKFSMCQYPFLISIGAKIRIMEHDARRQMELKAREAFFDSIMTRKSVNQYLVLRIRRECLVEDSLKGVSEVVGSGGEEIKKGLRIEFKGEEGIDAGGLRKEWFLLLVRDVFNPEHGMFVFDEDSHFCYFNPNSFETSDQYFLVGVVLGLAIYNSTILDVALPPFAFRKLLAAGPTAASGAPSHAKPTMTYSLEDLAELRPALANGLRLLLEYDGNVEETFCRDFVADVERYGQVAQIPLCPNGEQKPVTNSNRREFVDLYVRYLLDTAVSRQFEPFKRGFFTVCGGNALSLFRPEEIELLIRGSGEPLDIKSLQAVAICENWGIPNPAETEPVIWWFWDTFEQANPRDQRKLLSFITGSDRIPAMGAASLVIKLSCLGDDSPRFPVARTCFNMLSLWRYSSKEKLDRMLWRAVNESEGFGLK